MKASTNKFLYSTLCQWEQSWSNWNDHMYPKIPKKFHQQFIVCQNLLHPVILGLDFPHKYLVGIFCYPSNLLHLYQGLKSIVRLDPVPFPLHVNQISTLPLPHILVMMVSKVTIPPGIIAIIPTRFNGMPKPNCHYNMIESLVQYDLQQHLLVAPVPKYFCKKLPYNYQAPLSVQVLMKLSYPNTDTLVRWNHSVPLMTHWTINDQWCHICHWIWPAQHTIYTNSKFFLLPKWFQQWLKTCSKNINFNAQCHSNTQTSTPNWHKDLERNKK